MGRLKPAQPEEERPYELLVPAETLEDLLAEQEAGRAFYGESLYPPAKRRRPAEPSFLIYTAQQFVDHLGAWGGG